MRTLRVHEFRDLTATHLILYALYVDAIFFVVAAAIMHSGIGLTSQSVCRSAVYLCISFYVTSKVLMYYFLIERAHAVRGPHSRRLTDWVWVLFMFVLLVGITILAVLSLLDPEIEWRRGKCHIGLPPKTSIVLCIYDIIINFSLTGIFLWLLRPLLAFGRPTNVPIWKLWLTEKLAPYTWLVPFRLPEIPAYRQTLTREIVKARENLVRKTLIGSILVVFPTIANLSLLYAVGGKEMGWLCLTLCTSDGTSLLHYTLFIPIDLVG
jgi:hypothetical protein